jgi:tetratricopeptide (TPR) repeat protein
MADAFELRYPRALIDAVAGHLHLRRGELQRAVLLLERCVRNCESVDARFAILVMAGMLGPAFTLSARLPDALALFERTRDFAQAKGLVSFMTPVLAHLGDAYSRAGRQAEAVDAASRALDLARGHGLRGYEAWALYSLGEIRCRATPLEAGRAREAYEQGKSLTHELGMRPLEAMCALGLGTLSIRTGERDAATAQLTSAAGAFREMGMRAWLEQAEVALNDVGVR